MSIGQAMLAEFDQEMAGTRKTLERIPDDKMTYRPHPKSFIMGTLAYHVADLPNWATVTMTQDELEIAGMPGYPKAEDVKQADLLAKFDKHVAEARAAIAGASDETFMKPWSLKAHGTKVFTMSKIAVLRWCVMNHMIHHRAQLGVYLRMNDIPVPGLYGPSADEKS